MDKWFVTWNRSEYKEWARLTRGGYILLIIRKEQKLFLCVKAKLKMGVKGLPGFAILKEIYLPTEKEAEKQISTWKTGK